MRMQALRRTAAQRDAGDQPREALRIRGGVSLRGQVEVNGGKNAALALLAAAVLCDEPVTLENLPLIDDVLIMRELIESLGARVLSTGRSMTIDPTDVRVRELPEHLARTMRASYYLIGAMLGKFGVGSCPYPGGCNIGNRPIEQHVKGFEALGATMTSEQGGLLARADNLTGAEIYLDVVSVGATINIMLAAVRAKGNTIIVNAAKEPHIVDVANFLNAMGASVKGAGTEVIRIRGVKRMHGCIYAAIPDQIETGTLMIAAAATQGDVTIKGAIPTHMEALSAKLLELGAHVEEGIGEDSIRVWSNGRHRHVNVKTLPYPGFPTDLQQPMSALLSTARGISIVNETIYEMRFKHLDEIRRMGGKARINDRLAIIEGVPELTGCKIEASDLRAGAALVIAGMMAKGETIITNVHFIDRGYENFEGKLRSLGAHIDRIPLT